MIPTYWIPTAVVIWASMTLNEWIDLAIAIGTAIAAGAACFSAYATRRTSEAQLYVELMSEYASTEMEAALTTLRNTLDHWSLPLSSATYAEEIADWARRTVSVRPPNNPINDARRRVSHFYRKVTRVISEKLLNDGLRDELRHLSGRYLMHDIVIPLDRALSQEAGTKADAEWWITRFRKVFPDDREQSASMLPNKRLELAVRRGQDSID